jgi:nicotinamide-nucleotide amidase
MIVQAVAIGKEILQGSTLNTNSSFLSKALVDVGLKISRHLVIDDVEASIRQTVEEALEAYDLSIFCGGLGPTCDDLTKEVVAKVMGKKLEIHPVVFSYLSEKYPTSQTIKNQSLQLDTAILLENSLGTAFGFIVKKGAHYAAFLPGVPIEFQHMVEQQLIPWIKQNYTLKPHFLKKYLILQKNEQQVDPFLRTLQEKIKGVEFGIYPNYGYLLVHMSTEDEQTLLLASQAFEKEFSTFCVENFENPQSALHHLLIQKKWKLAVAESCTGGKVGESITKLSQASDYFLGGIIAYSNEAKIQLLQIEKNSLNEHGAVSKQCALKMAENVRKLFSADIGLSTTGIAGPHGGSIEKPVGTIYVAISLGHQTYVGKIPQTSIKSRELLIQYTTNYLFTSLYRYLTFNIIPFEESK